MWTDDLGYESIEAQSRHSERTGSKTTFKPSRHNRSPSAARFCPGQKAKGHCKKEHHHKDHQNWLGWFVLRVRNIAQNILNEKSPTSFLDPLRPWALPWKLSCCRYSYWYLPGKMQWFVGWVLPFIPQHVPYITVCPVSCRSYVPKVLKYAKMSIKHWNNTHCGLCAFRWHQLLPRPVAEAKEKLCVPPPAPKFTSKSPSARRKVCVTAATSVMWGFRLDVYSTGKTMRPSVCLFISLSIFD